MGDEILAINGTHSAFHGTLWDDEDWRSYESKVALADDWAEMSRTPR